MFYASTFLLMSCNFH